MSRPVPPERPEATPPAARAAASAGGRALAKRVAHLLAIGLVAPALCSFWARARLLGRDRAILASSQALALIPGLTGQYLRRAFYCRTLEGCHWTAVIEFGTVFSKAGARIGENVYIGPMCHLGLVDVGKDTLIAAGVHIPSGPITHGIDDRERPIREQPGELRRIWIGDGCWIGSAAAVLADVGAGTVVAAGAVVTRALPPQVIAAGVPARILRWRQTGRDDSASRGGDE